MTSIGYYVHHQGAGHLDRALAIAAHAPDRFTLIGTHLSRGKHETQVLQLPDDRLLDSTKKQEAAGCFHYAPLFHDGIRHRVAILSKWIADCRPLLMVVDVSVEIAMLSRLAATPFIYVRLSGKRDDAPHLEAFRQAHAIIAPFHAALDEEHIAEPVRSKTFYAPGILQTPVCANQAKTNTILFVFGKGGSPGAAETILSCARSCPDATIEVLGPTTPFREIPPNLNVMGWVDDAIERISRAKVVVAGGGDGVVSAVLAAGKPFVCIPEARPYGEQSSKARALALSGCAITLDAWPAAADWPGVIESALALETWRCRSLHDPQGAKRACDFILQVASQVTSEGPA